MQSDKSEMRDERIDRHPVNFLIQTSSSSRADHSRPWSRYSPFIWAAAFLPPTGWLAVIFYAKARRALRSGDEYLARVMMRRSRAWLVHTFSLGLALGAAAFTVLILTANGHAVIHTFFDTHVLRISIPSVLAGFWLNVKLFLIVEVVVLPWAFVVALLRVTSSKSWALSRWLAVVYVDVFRGIPAVIVIYLIAFGIPISSLPILGDTSSFVLCAVALIIVYGAYVAEEFRAGIASVHWSQGAAARSLGLTSTQSMLYVIAPQAIRRMVPPLLNQFIALQKDTSLVSFVGLLDAFNRSRIIASNEFNLSAVTGVALFFVIITIPLARLVDYIAKRDAERMQQVAR